MPLTNRRNAALLKNILNIAGVLFILNITPALAAIEDSYDSEEPLAVTAWYERAGIAEQAADQAFINGMRPHHQGALSMSIEYLKDSRSTNGTLRQLARGIIHNQTFEIGMLDTVEGYLLDNSDRSYQQIAAKGLAQRQQFYRAPMPGPLDAWAGDKDISIRDVQFAKAMIVHHQAALDMAHDYLGNPDARNGYLELMCIDILLDQSQEIILMQSMIDKYPGDADAIKIDKTMVHGMDHMSHGGHTKH
ncbi:MAG: DUF305 domain-containing protein [Micavibrio sp.]